MYILWNKRRQIPIKIETYWNVNMLPRYGCTAMYCLIKIETYWNVNVFVDGTSPITTELK